MGKGDMASWFLKFIIVHDIQTREKFYFLCQNWLAVENGDGQIERCLFVALDAQKTQLSYLIEKQAKNYVFDYHLWLSVFIRPVKSTFTRLDRVTCCFVFHYISMLLNLLYYDSMLTQTLSNISSMRFDSSLFSFTLEQILVGILIDVLTYFPLLFLAFLFRRAKSREKKKNTTSNTSQKYEISDKKSNFKFPWWFKIIFYLISWVCMAISIAFALFKGK
jgi:polycystin 1L2